MYQSWPFSNLHEKYVCWPMFSFLCQIIPLKKLGACIFSLKEFSLDTLSFQWVVPQCQTFDHVPQLANNGSWPMALKARLSSNENIGQQTYFSCNLENILIMANFGTSEIVAEF